MNSELHSPCHGVVTVGGPKTVWCPTCGRAYRADDPRLASAPPLAPTFAQVCADDYASAAAVRHRAVAVRH